LIPYNKIFVS
jgi:translation initiation factor 2 subunit 1